MSCWWSAIALSKPFQASARECFESVVIFLKRIDSPLVDVDYFQQQNTLHRYRVIRLWEQDSAPFLADPALLPLAPLTRTDSPLALLEQVAAQVDLIADFAQRRETLACTSILAGLLHQPHVIRPLFREDIMEESLFYQEIIQKGEQKGLQKGLQLGQQQQALSQTLRQLMRRVGAIAPATEERIRALSFTQLELLSEALLDFSTPADLMDWLNNLN